MSLKVFLNSLGLVLDTRGAFLICRYGLPEILGRKGEVFLIADQEDASEKATAKKYDWYSHIGILLLGLGFVLQLVRSL